jgi:hypothetical protein
MGEKKMGRFTLNTHLETAISKYISEPPAPYLLASAGQKMIGSSAVSTLNQIHSTEKRKTLSQPVQCRTF